LGIDTRSATSARSHAVQHARKVLLGIAIIALAWGLIVMLTGGIDARIGGLVIRSRDPFRAVLAGVALLLLHAAFSRAAWHLALDRLVHLLATTAPALAGAAALLLSVHAVKNGAFVAGGADAYGYVSQAYGWAQGTLPRGEVLPVSVPWPSGDASLAPLGYRIGPEPHTIVPTYAPGLPLIMAATTFIAGACGPFLVVPLCAALVVWLTFRLGRRAGGAPAGLLAAIFVTTSPVVVFQALWPMSDIPAAALWTGATVAALGDRRRNALACGLWAAVGLLVRPNLPVVPLVLLAHLAFSSRGRERWIRMALFCAAVAPAAIGIAALNAAWYGAPWNSGYGAATELYSFGNVASNLTRYPVWLWQTQTPLVLFALVPFVPRFRGDADAGAVRLCAAVFLATLGCYLLYSPFEEWWYLRFLLPAMPALLVLMSTGMVALGRRLPKPRGRVKVAAVALLLVVFTTRFNVAHGMFGPLKDVERRYADVGVYLHDALPPNAIVFSVQQSGSARYYGGRMTIRWDLIDRDWTARAAADVERLGLHPYMVIEDWELPQMREWFGLAPDAPTPWPLVARLRDPIGVSVLDLSSHPAIVVPVALTQGRAPRYSAQQPLTVERR
jgi:Dolichyl-phosphate-mannose-protein mannosyltransferase